MLKDVGGLPDLAVGPTDRFALSMHFLRFRLLCRNFFLHFFKAAARFPVG
jgi:hypothetical protein